MDSGPPSAGALSRGDGGVWDVDAVVARRAGSVLGPGTSLKHDHFPGCRASPTAARTGAADAAARAARLPPPRR